MDRTRTSEQGNAVTPAAQAGVRRTDLLTVVVEDYFHVVAFRKLIQPSQWYRFERRIEANTRRALDLLDEFDVRATFFVLGWVAEEMPEVVRAIADRGHEVATKGHHHRAIHQFTPGEFREDLLRSKEALERACGLAVRGHRVARGHLGLSDLWALDVLAEEGFAYDSSVYPRLRSIAAEPWRRFPHLHEHRGRKLWELPLATWKLGPWLAPIAGGNYFRQLPLWAVDRAIRSWHERYEAPFVMYFHVWELDNRLPEITAAGLLTRIRQYRNLERMPSIIRHQLSRYAFTSIADHLDLPREPAVVEEPREREVLSVAPRSRDRLPVTIVIPCFNEERVLSYLGNTLRKVQDELGTSYDVRLIFVDDGSTDGTWSVLERVFGDRADVRLIRHDRNQGVAAAILTGLREAETEVVCSIDCDCTYDPLQLRELIPMLEDDVAMVTGSPYHPSGRVLNVPRWRLFLSRGLSALYRGVSRQKLNTYTSCFRVYRRSRVQDVVVREAGFLGVAEMLCTLDARGDRIVECPAVLEVRMLGRSKMKLLPVILGHLRLLCRMAISRPGPSAEAEAGTPG